MRRRLILATIIASIVAVVIVGAVALRKLWRQGLGPLGTAVWLHVDVEHRYAPTQEPAETVKQAADVLKKRLRAYGEGASLNMKVAGERIVVILPGVADGEPSVSAWLARSARIELMVIDARYPLLRAAASRPLPPGVEAASDRWKDAGGVEHEDVFFRSSNEEALRSFVKQLRHQLDASHQLLYGTPDGQGVVRTYCVWAHDEVDSRALRDAEVVGDRQLELRFDDDGSKRLETLTAAHVGDKLAVVFERRVESATVIAAPIAGGKTRVTLGVIPDARSAESLVKLLRDGGLPAPLIVERTKQVTLSNLGQP
jgi:preprotein translocase subunit SecD